MVQTLSLNLSKEIHLASRPIGLPKLNDFIIVEKKIPEVKEEEVLVQNIWMSVDPYMRGRMDDSPSYIPPFKLNSPLEGSAIGKVISSRSTKFIEGEYVISMFGWRETFVSQAKYLKKLNLTDMPNSFPIELHLSILGNAGLTAYAALFRIANLKPSEKIFISGATGAVGSVACTLAKSIGCYVVGTAGNEEKRKWLEKELKIDVAINYNDTKFSESIIQAFPHGIDVYLENAGGEQLRVALDNMKQFGRIAFSGMIDGYNNVTQKPGPSNLFQIIKKSLKLEGFISTNHQDLNESFLNCAYQLLNSGKLKWNHSVSEGIESSPQAMIDLFTGKSFGKTLVKLSAS
ncbi:NADP-dependent oxidoreductase [Silvanigrella sp.]|jgi:NADPH-dependent curcumin reductase CurA|uniref:NADP-dependent oxidoreductase n=1 Tax=Silvanigrella sp. TaxID=2024976 RepID=UPI0037C9D785